MYSDIIDIKYIPKILILFLDKIIDDGNNKIKKICKRKSEIVKKIIK
jgi:hypothetical protein